MHFRDWKEFEDVFDLEANLTYDTAKKLLLDLALMELAHRFMACLYEVCELENAISNNNSYLLSCTEDCDDGVGIRVWRSDLR